MWISVNFEYLAGEKGTAEEAGPPKAFRMILSSCYPAQTGRFLLAAGLPGSSLWHKSKHGSSFCVRIPSERWELFLVSSTSAERSTRLPVPGIWLRKKKKNGKKNLVLWKRKAEIRAKETLLLLWARKENSPQYPGTHCHYTRITLHGWLVRTWWDVAQDCQELKINKSFSWGRDWTDWFPWDVSEERTTRRLKQLSPRM